MQKLSLNLFEKHQLSGASNIWGGTTDPNCYTMSQNQGMSDAGFCDIVFSVDSKAATASSQK